MMRYLSRVLFAVAVLGAASSAFAATLTINASVAKSCVVTTSSATMTVPIWDPISGAAPTDGTAAYNMKCTRGTTINVAATLGSGGAGGTGYPRSVKSATTGGTIGYKLYAGDGTTTGTKTELTDATAQTLGVAGQGKNAVSTVTMTASLDPASDPLAATDYTDTVTLTFSAN